jgi:hypothetical protein
MKRVTPVLSREAGRAFAAGLLSFAMLLSPFVQIAPAFAQSVKSKRAQTPSTAAPAAQSPSKGGGSTGSDKRLTLPAPQITSGSPTIVATKTDNLAQSTQVAPGGTINYSVTITNTGNADATGVTFNDTVDANTTVDANSGVMAIGDDYNTIGNVQISIPAPGLLANDLDIDGGSNAGMTTTAATKSSANCAACNNVTIGADGSFNYDPPAGFNGTDAFTYTANTAGGKSATVAVQVAVSGRVWFVNNSAGACSSNCDGRLSHPFTSLANFQALNDNGAALTHAKTGDTIFIYTGGGNYTGGTTLLGGQILIGQGATATVETITGLGTPSGSTVLPATGGTNPAITNSVGNDISLTNGSAGNTVRGVTLGSSSAAGFAVAGTNFGTLTLGDLTINNGAGGALNLTTGTLSATIASVTTSGAADGMSLTGIGGTLTVNGSGTMSGASGATFNVNGGTLSVTYSGNISQANNAALVSVTSHSSGTITFQTGTLSATNGSGLQFANADGTYNFNGTTTLSSGGAQINIAAGTDVTNGSQGTFSFGTGTSISGSGTTNAPFVHSGSKAGVTYSGNITQAQNARMIDITSQLSGGTITFQTGTLSASNGTGININSAAGSVSLNGTTTLNGGDAGVDISSSSGSFGFNSNTSIGATTSPSGIAFNVSGGTPVVKYDGTIKQTSGAAAVSISGVTGGATNGVASPYSILFTNTITKNTTAANAVSVGSNTGGSFGFTGNVTATTTTANAINLTSNSSATITFTGTLALTTTTGVAFNATGGGTVNATDASSTVSETGSAGTGIGVNIVNTTIGGSGVKFLSVNANGGSAGIFLDTTGAGAFSVTGTVASVTKDNSGGTIQNMTGTDGTSNGHGVYMNGVQNVSLKHLSIQGNQGDGVHGNNVTNMTLQYCNIGTTAGNGNSTALLPSGCTVATCTEDGEGDVQLYDLKTSALIDNNSMANAHYNTLIVLNNHATSINRVVVTNNIFGNQNAATGNDAATFQATDGTFNVTFSNNTVNYAVGDTFQLNLHGNVASDLIMLSNTMNNSAGAAITSGGGGVTIGSGGASDKTTLTFNIDGNTMTGALGAAFGLSTQSTGVGGFFQNYSGTFNNNTIGNPAVTDSGASGAGSSDLGLIVTGSLATISITNNHLYQYNPATNGAMAITVQDDAGNVADAKLTVTGNVISNPGSNATNVMQGIAVNVGPSASDVSKACITMFSNTLTGSGKNGGSELRMRQRASTHVGLIGSGGVGYSGGANDTTAVVNFLTANNTVTSSAAVTATTNAPGGFQGTCPPLMFAPGGVMSADQSPLPSLLNLNRFTSIADFAHASGAHDPDGTPEANAPALEPAEAVASLTPAGVSYSLTRRQLDAAVAAAIERWSGAGLTGGQLSTLRGLKFEIADLTGSYLGEASSDRILVDCSARGHGWFIEADPASDALFARAVSATRRYTDPLSAPAGRVDLLTAVEHEMGHRLGLEDTYAASDRDGLMYGYLTVGERRLPSAGQAAVARAAAGKHFLALAPLSSEPAKGEAQSAASAKLSTAATKTQSPVAKTGAPSSKPSRPFVTLSSTAVSANIGTLHAGDSVQINFSVTVNTPFPNGVSTVSNQGTVSGSNFSNVLTDDPDVAGQQATVTQILTPPDISARDAKVAEPASGQQATMLFTVTLNHAFPPTGTSVNFATANGGAAPAVGGASCDGSTDYLTTSGTLSFGATETIKTIPVTVCGRGIASDKTLLLNLSAPSAGQVVRSQAVGTITVANAPGTLLISELRTSGPSGTADDFVELYNNTNSPMTVAASDASGGYGVFKMGADCTAAPVLVGTIPSGTVIPARGHYLLVGTAYSLATAAAGDQTMTADVENDRNVAVFTTADVTQVSSAARLDAVGFGTNVGGNVCDLLREGTTLAAVAAVFPGAVTNYSFFRNEAGTGQPADTNDNASDFLFADPADTLVAGQQRLGVAGPENLASPINRGATIKASLFDPGVSSTASPNRERDSTPNSCGTSTPAGNCTSGTLTIRRTFTNQTGGNVTRLRFRVVDITTAPQGAGNGTADLRVLTSLALSNVSTSQGNKNVAAMTLDPPTQNVGSGYNSSIAAGGITLGTPLAANASVSVQFVLGVQQTGSFRFFVIVEALP